MLRRLNNIDVVELANYTVTLQRITNGQYGTPRYEAVIIYTGEGRGMDRSGYKYRFTGHYYSERQEAEWILEQHLKKEDK